MIERQVDLQQLPNLTHSKILDATLAGQKIANPKWNVLFKLILIRAMKQHVNFDELKQLCPANILRGYKDDEGYSHLPEIDVSFQGMSANDACSALVETAQSLGIGLDIALMWRRKEGAMYPGEKARLFVPGKP